VVFRPVPVADLPQKWRNQLAPAAEAFATDDPLFGLSRDREDMTDVAGDVRKLRASRLNDDGTRRGA